MPIQFDENGHALEDGTVTIFHYDPNTGVLGGEDTTQTIKGFGIPANSTLLAPPTVAEGSVAVFRNGVWATDVDNRQTKVWLKADGSQAVGGIGPLPDTVVTTEPTGAFVSWDDTQNKWVFNQKNRDTQMKTQAQAALAQARLYVTNNYALIGEATPDAWVSYLKALMAIENGTDTTSVALPAQPSN